MTLQEAKDQIAKKYDCKEWEHFPFLADDTRPSMFEALDEAAELYASSKLQELEKKYQNVSSWNVDALKEITKLKGELQELEIANKMYKEREACPIFRPDNSSSFISRCVCGKERWQHQI